jgi:peptide/nickel transport system substrate-binding protein
MAGRIVYKWLMRQAARLQGRALPRHAPGARSDSFALKRSGGLPVCLALLALGAGLIGLAAGRGTAGSEMRTGGTFRISMFPQFLDYVDPALSYTPSGWALLDPVCARLMTYPDKPPPEGFRIVPEVAASYPRVSHDWKTYTFTLRSGFRFSDGAPVRASAFARAINRTLAPGMNSPGAQYTREIVGAEGVLAGRRSAAAGVVARGKTLVVRFTRPVHDFAAQTTMPFFCAVPPMLPADPEGVGAFPAAGPYYIAEYRPGQGVVIRRNRFYSGTRPHRVDGFLVDLTADSVGEVLDRVERGEADWGFTPAPFAADPERGLAAKYGINMSRFFVKPALEVRGYALNMSRPLFRNNPRLRRAVNFAIDRPAVRRAFAGGALSATLTDQYLPPALRAFRNARIYPLNDPDLRTARSLARGNTRGGKAVLYTIDLPPPLAAAQVVRQNLARIGLDVEVKGIPRPAYFARIAAAGEPFDIAYDPWAADYADPYSFVNLQFDGRFIGTTNVPRFNSPRYNRLMRQAARLQGPARDRAYGRLDVRLARDVAPMVAFANFNELTLVSKRVDLRCVVLRPGLDLTAVCLK